MALFKEFNEEKLPILTLILESLRYYRNKKK
jgi:hypothetical protein